MARWAADVGSPMGPVPRQVVGVRRHQRKRTCVNRGVVVWSVVSFSARKTCAGCSPIKFCLGDVRFDDRMLFRVRKWRC